MAWKYQVGELTNPRPEDAKFDDWSQAVDCAKKLACAEPNAPIAFWDDHCDVVLLFLCGQVFKPE